MAWKIEEADAVEGDMRSIFTHVFESQLGFGYSAEEAFHLARQRIAVIRGERSRIARAPQIGTRHKIAGREIRHVTFDRAIYWFTLDTEAEIVRIEGVFFGGQDHLGRMLARLVAEGDG